LNTSSAAATSPAPHLYTKTATPEDAERVYQIYCGAPKYFDILSAPLPTLPEVERELEVAEQDPKRCAKLLLEGDEAVGYLDYKLDYPEKQDATVNLILIPEPLQSHGYGRRAMALLEEELQGKARRILASIYGNNLRAKRFWRSLGYRFAIDARPILEWYAKEL
jgi:RimJ/RimL family protein N-acetyltransferase